MERDRVMNRIIFSIICFMLALSIPVASHAALSSGINGREYDKFVLDQAGNTAVRTYIAGTSTTVISGNSGLPIITGQVKIATTGTAVQLNTGSTILANGLILSSYSTNNSTGVTWGKSTVSNVVNGTGNGKIIAAGASDGVPSGVNIGTIYINGTTGDVVSYAGN